LLTTALEQETTDFYARLSQALVVVTGRLAPTDAAAVLTRAVERAKDSSSKAVLAQGLAAVAGRMGAREAGPAANILIQSLEKETDANTRNALAQGLAAVVQPLDRGEASRMCSPLIDNLISTAEKAQNQQARTSLVASATNLLQAMDSETATSYSNKLARSIWSGSLRLHELKEGMPPGMGMMGPEPHGVPSLPSGIDPVLTNSSRTEVIPRAAAAATAVGLATHGPFAALAPLPAAGDPLPCRLSTQDLVDLLKMPTCFGAGRQVALEHLGNRYGRRFANHWEFVRFAHEHHLDLDFTTPPKRPARP
jgi:hypothetical protein